ncbi:MAG: hypothetical protein QXG52_07275 [Candidatus Caldarchaeum sp.]
MNFVLTILMIVVLMVFAVTLLAAATTRGTGRADGFAFFLIGPFPVILRGKPWVALLAAAVLVILLLLVMR